MNLCGLSNARTILVEYYAIWLRNNVFYFNHFSLIILYHSVWLGFGLFWLRIQVYSQLVQFTLARTGYDNHHCHNKLPDRKLGWSVDDAMPRRDRLSIWKILKKIELRSYHGVEKLGSDNAVEDLRLDHAGRQLSLGNWDRELSFLLRSWVFYRLCFAGPNRRRWNVI